MNFAGTTPARVLAITLFATAAFIANANAKQSAPAKSPAQSKSSAISKAAPIKSSIPEIALPIQIIPQPVSVVPGKGSFVFTAHTQIVAAATQQALAEQLRDYLRPATGFSFPIVRAAGPT